MQNGRGWGTGASPRWEGALPPPPKLNNEKKRLSGNFNLFHLYFTNEFRGGGIGIHATWKGVGGQARVHAGGGRRRGYAPPRKWKKDAVRGNFNLTYILLIKLEGGGGVGISIHAIWKG